MMDGSKRIAGIPRIIHQIWKTDEVPCEWKTVVRSWARQNPDWEYRLWTDRAVKIFIRNRYPHMCETYENLTYDIQRADFARYLILHDCGGVYADLDVECLRPLSKLLDGHEFVACREPEEHSRTSAVQEMVCNAFLASLPSHRLLAAVIKEVVLRARVITCHGDLLTSTGPVILASVIRDYEENDFTVMDSRVSYPFVNHARELIRLKQGGIRADRLRERLIADGTWVVHYWANSWIRSLAGELQNPQPNQITGYRFYQGWDSHGFDKANGGREVKTLARMCDTTKNSQGFNTDGFIKYRLRPKISWRRMSDAAWNEGLYVRSTSTKTLNAALSGFVLSFVATLSRIGLRRRK